MGHLASEQARVRRHVLGNAAVNHGQVQAMQAREYRDRQLRVQGHLHLIAGRSAPLRAGGVDDDAVVGREQGQDRVTEPRREAVLDQTKAHRERLQFAQATRDGGAAVHTIPQSEFELRIGGGRYQRLLGDGHGAGGNQTLRISTQARNKR